MSKIEPIRVRIQNFQSIEDIEFTIRGFTTITGKTNIGKSAIIRAISSAILNSPVVNMVRHGEKFCTVDLHSKDWGFQWKKAEKGLNRYHIDGKEEPLDSVGRGQIEEIKEMGFGTIKIAENKYLSPWYANQYESVFLLNQSGPAITDFISEVSRLDVLQRGIVYINTEKKRYKDKIKFLNGEIETLQAKQAKFARLEEIQNVRDDLKLQKESIELYETRIANAQRLSNQIDSIQRSIDLLEHIQSVRVPPVPNVEEFERIQKMNQFRVRLQSGAQRVIKLRDIDKINVPELGSIPDIEKLKLAASILTKKERLERFIALFPEKIEIPEPLEEFPARLITGIRLLKRAKTLQAEIEKLEAQDKELSGKLEEVSAKIKEIPKCPTCERPWDHRH